MEQEGIIVGEIELPDFVTTIKKPPPSINQPLIPSERLNQKGITEIIQTIDLEKLKRERSGKEGKTYKLTELRKIARDIGESDKGSKKEVLDRIRRKLDIKD